MPDEDTQELLEEIRGLLLFLVEYKVAADFEDGPGTDTMREIQRQILESIPQVRFKESLERRELITRIESGTRPLT